MTEAVPPRSRGASLARWVSIVAHPFAVVVALLVAAAYELEGAAGLRTALPLALAAVTPVALLMHRQVRRGRWQNVDASNREERPVLFAVAAATMAGLLVWLALRDGGAFAVRGLLATLAMVAVAAAVNRRLKLSLHMAFAAFAATALLWLGSPAGWALAALLPALAWSRLALARHVAAELLGGALLGVAAGWLVQLC